MKHVAHLMEKRDHVVVAHQSVWTLGRDLRKVGDHGCDGVYARRRSVDGISGDERPDGSVAVFIIWAGRGYMRYVRR